MDALPSIVSFCLGFVVFYFATPYALKIFQNEPVGSLGVWKTAWVVRYTHAPPKKIHVTAEAIVQGGRRKVLLQLGEEISRAEAIAEWSALQQLLIWEKGGTLPPPQE